MNGYLIPQGKTTYVDSNGRPLMGGKLFFYDAGTQTPKDTWQDLGKTVLNTNPVILDARGQASLYGSGSYRQVLEDQFGNLIFDQVINDPQDAAQIHYVFPDGTVHTVQDLSDNQDESLGAAGIGYRGSNVASALDNLARKHDLSKTYTVGPTGDYPTINEALTAVSEIFGPVYRLGGVIIELKLQAGFVMREQVLLGGGIDLGWVRITATDPSVTIDPAYITQALSEADDSYPAFGALDNSTLPVIGCLFSYADNTSSRDGVAVMRGSMVGFLPGAGVVRSRRGLLVFYGSEAHCYPLGLTQGGDGTGAGTQTGVDFSYARLRGLHVAYGSRGALGRGKFHHCDGDFGVYVIWGCQVDVYQSDASYCVNGTAFHARDGSFMNCRESNGSHSRRAFHALHNGRINARSRLSGPTMIWIGDGAQFCTQYGVLASYGSQVEAAELNAGNCTGSAGISASDGSTISFVDGSAKNCTIRGVWAQNGSTVSAARADVSNCQIGLSAISASTIAAPECIAKDCVSAGTDIGFGALAVQGSTIDVQTGTITGCNRNIESRESSSINARGADLSTASDRCVSAIDGGRINAQEAKILNAGSIAITSRNGAHVSAYLADCTGAALYAAQVMGGGIIAFPSGIGAPLSQTPNQITANGIIFQ